MSRIEAFIAFWYDFIIGDDWRVAAGAIIALAATAVLAATTDVAAWWIMPVAAMSLLAMSLWREARRR